MIGADEIAVCVSGLAREGYKEVIERAKKVFPYNFFYMQWEGYPQPDVPVCEYFIEPVYNYHNLLDTKYRPECAVLKRVTRTPNGKIFRKAGLLEQTRTNSKQILAHYWLVNKLPAQYKTIIKLRYDSVVSNQVDFTPFIERARCGTVVGFAGGEFGGDMDAPLREHSSNKHTECFHCRRCTGFYLFDHVIFHPREKLKNVEKLFNEKNLLGAEWGWHQILCHQWCEDNNYVNVTGGNRLVKHRKN